MNSNCDIPKNSAIKLHSSDGRPIPLFDAPIIFVLQMHHLYVVIFSPLVYWSTMHLAF